MYKRILILLLLLSSTLFSRTIVTVTYPFQEYFIKKIADNKIYTRVVFDENREFKLSDRRLVETLSRSKYYFSLNLEEEKPVLEKFLSKNEDLKIIDMSKNVGTLKLNNGEKNPYVWMDPILVRDIATNIYEELVKIRSYDRALFKANLERFLIELDEIYLHLRKRVNDSETFGLFSFSHKLDYLAKRYRLDVFHKEFKYLNASEVPEIITFARKNHIRHIVISTNSDYLVAQSLSGHIDGKIVEVDIYDRNWKSNLYKIIRGLTH